MKHDDHPERLELLGDIFASDTAPGGIRENDVIALIDRARRTRMRRRQVAAGAVVALVLAGWSFLSSDRVTDPSQRVAGTIPPAMERSAAMTNLTPAAATPPSIEKVNDEEMLALLDETPAAVVQWPDGRRSLLVLVSTSATPTEDAASHD